MPLNLICSTIPQYITFQALRYTTDEPIYTQSVPGFQDFELKTTKMVYKGVGSLFLRSGSIKRTIGLVDVRGTRNYPKCKNRRVS